MKRNIQLCVYTPAGEKVCDLYDSLCQFNGQAANVKIQYNESELTTLTFDLPRTIVDEHGREIDNPKWDDVVDEYLVYYTEDDNTEVFIIHSVTDGVQGFRKSCSVSCIQRGEELKRRGFATSYESYVGRADEQLQKALEGSGWSAGVSDFFYEDAVFEKHISGTGMMEISDDVSPNSYVEIYRANGKSVWNSVAGWQNASFDITTFPKNLCDGIIEKGRLDANGEPVYEADLSAYRSIDYMQVGLFQGVKLSVSGVNVGGAKMYFYGADKALIGTSVSAIGITVPAGAVYCKYELYANAAGTQAFVNPPAHVQIEVGEVATAYEQYYPSMSIRTGGLGEYDYVSRGLITRATVYDDTTHTTSESDKPTYESLDVYTAKFYKNGTVFIRSTGVDDDDIITAYTVNEESEYTLKREKVRVLSKDANTSTYDALKNITDQFGGYLVLHGEDRTVDLVTTIGDDSGICFDVNYNTKSIKRVKSSTDMVTRLYNGHDDISIANVNPLGVNYVLNFGYYDTVMTQDQKDAVDQFNETVPVLAEEIGVLYEAKTMIDNSINDLAGRTPTGFASVASASGTTLTIGSSTYYNNGSDPNDGDTLYAMSEDGAWTKYGVTGFSAGTRTVTLDATVGQANITQCVWYRGVMPGMIGGRIIAVKTKQDIITAVEEQLAAADDETEIEALTYRLQELRGEMTALLVGTPTNSGLYQMFAALVAYVTNAKSYDDVIAYDQQEIADVNANLETMLGGMIKDGVYEDLEYVSGQEDALYNDMVSYLAEHSVPQVEYSVDALDRSAYEYELHGRVHFGDIVYVSEHSLGIENLPARVISYTDTPQDDRSNAFNIGNFGKNGEDMFQKILDSTKLIQEKVSKIDRSVVLNDAGLIPPEIIAQSILASDVGKDIDLQSNESLNKQDISEVDSFQDAVEEAVQNKITTALLNATSVEWSKIKNLNLDLESLAVNAAHVVVDPVSNRVTTVESSIQQVPEQIRLAVGEIDIGATNLLLGTDVIAEITNTTTERVEMEFTSVGYMTDLIGKEMTYSFDRYMPGGVSVPIDPADELSSRFGALFTFYWMDSTGTLDPITTVDSSLLDYTSGSIYDRVSYTFTLTAPTGYDILQRIVATVDARRKPPSGPQRVFTIGHVKLEVGNKATSWSPAPEDGASILDTGNESVQVKIAKDRFDVNVNGGSSEMVINESGAVFENVTITNEINAPNLLKTFSGGNYSIGTPPVTDTRSYVRIYATLSDFMSDASYKALTGFTTVYLNKDISESITLIGLSGIRLAINGNGHDWFGSARFSSCDCGEIVLENVDMYATVAGTMVYIDGCRYVNLTNVSFHGNMVATQMAYYLQGSHGMVINCGFYDEAGNTATGIFAAYSSVVYVQNQKGGVSHPFIGAGCTVCWSGTRALGQMALAAPCITNPADLSTLPTDPGEGGGGGEVEPTTVSFTAQYTRNCRGTGSWDSSGAAQTGIQQNYYNGTIFKGCVWFNIPAGTFTGKTIKSMALRLHRPGNGYGTTASISVKLAILTFTYAENLAQVRTLPNTFSGSSYYSDGVYNNFFDVGSIQRNSTVDFDLYVTDGMVQHILANHGIALFGGETSALYGKTYSANYGQFSGAATDLAPELLITYV